MRQASSLPQLHAGLIERARIPVPIAPDAPLMQLSPTNATKGGPPGQTLARPGVGTALTVDPQPGLSAHAGQRRYGLTVRVGPDLRAELDLWRAETGATIQCILHQALVKHLAAARH